MYAVSWLLVAWLAKISWRTLSATPSAVAVAGTRWSKRSPALFAFRFTLFVWHLLVLIALGVSNYMREVEGKPKHAHWFYQFFFFTIWNYALQMVAWGVSASASAMALCSASGPRPWQRRLTHTLLSVAHGRQRRDDGSQRNLGLVQHVCVDGHHVDGGADEARVAVPAVHDDVIAVSWRRRRDVAVGVVQLELLGVERPRHQVRVDARLVTRRPRGLLRALRRRLCRPLR